MKFNDFLHNYKLQQAFPHALLVECDGCIDYALIIKNYLKALVCEQNIFCNQCPYCKKVDHDAYIDLIVIDCNDNQLSKEDVMHVQQQFSILGCEKSNIKLYSIINIENANKASINSLLKFIEEPPQDTFALFFCRNSEAVLKTIYSRCHRIKITNENNFDNELINYCFDSKKQYENFSEEFNIEEEIKLIKDVINANVLKQIEFASKIKNVDYKYLPIFINMIAYHLTIEKKVEVKALKKYLSLNVSKALLVNKILSILEN